MICVITFFFLYWLSHIIISVKHMVCVFFAAVVVSLFFVCFLSTDVSIVFFWYCLVYPFEFSPAPVTLSLFLLRLSYIRISLKELKEAKGNLTVIDMVLHSINGSDRFSCLVTICFLFELFTCFEVLLKLITETHFSSHWEKFQLLCG